MLAAALGTHSLRIPDIFSVTFLIPGTSGVVYPAPACGISRFLCCNPHRALGAQLRRGARRPPGACSASDATGATTSEAERLQSAAKSRQRETETGARGFVFPPNGQSSVVPAGPGPLPMLGGPAPSSLPHPLSPVSLRALVPRRVCRCCRLVLDPVTSSAPLALALASSQTTRKHNIPTNPSAVSGVGAGAGAGGRFHPRQYF